LPVIVYHEHFQEDAESFEKAIEVVQAAVGTRLENVLRNYRQNVSSAEAALRLIRRAPQELKEMWTSAETEPAPEEPRPPTQEEQARELSSDPNWEAVERAAREG
jgi:hypothetical protein